MRLRSGTEIPKQHTTEKTDPNQAQTSISMKEMQGGDGGPGTSQEGRVRPPQSEIQVPRWGDALNSDRVLTAEDRSFFLEMKHLEAEKCLEVKALRAGKG
ncbi:unnamed protein product [Caretta caretta]